MSVCVHAYTEITWFLVPGRQKTGDCELLVPDPGPLQEQLSALNHQTNPSGKR